MKKKGFALVITVITVAIVLGIFFNYSRATRSKKKMTNASLSNTAAEKSVQEANSIAFYEMYLADQMITANNQKIVKDGGTTLDHPLVGEATAIQNIVGYFTVKNSILNNTMTSQISAIKVWDELDNSVPNGIWYYGKWSGAAPNYVFTTYKYPGDTYEVPLTKGGYIITGITDVTNPSNPNNLFSVELDEYKIPILNTTGNRIKYKAADGTPKGKIKYKPGVKAAYEVKLFKNVTLFKKKVMEDKTGIFENAYNFNEVLRSYNIYVTLKIYWSNNSAIQLSDPNMRNYCAAAPNPGVSLLVGADCGVDAHGDMIASEVESFVVEDITPVVE